MGTPTLYYVDSVAGSNANNGTSAALAYETLEYARDNLTFDTTNGITLYVRGTHALTANWATAGFTEGDDVQFSLVAYDMVDSVFTESNGVNGITATVNCGIYRLATINYHNFRGLIFNSTNTSNSTDFTTMNHGVAENCQFNLANNYLELNTVMLRGCLVTASAGNFYLIRQAGNGCIVTDCLLKPVGASITAAVQIIGTYCRVHRTRILIVTNANGIETNQQNCEIRHNSIHTTNTGNTAWGIKGTSGGWAQFIDNNVISGFATGIDLSLNANNPPRRRARSVRNNSVFPKTAGTAFVIDNGGGLPTLSNETLVSAPFVAPASDDFSTSDIGSIRGGAYQFGNTGVIDRGALQAASGGGNTLAAFQHGKYVGSRVGK